MNQADPPVSDQRDHQVQRYELWAVVAITLLGAAVRFAFPSAMAIEHFDEGVYASNLLFPDRGDQYPDRHLYAPSLVPWLIEWSIIFFGDKGIAPMLPSLLLGTLTIPLMWWIGRQWFGPLAGVGAATLLSLSDFHIAFSRSALTDVPLCFWLLLAVYLFERAFRDLSWSAAVFAGLTTGLAWWTKYNGWLPLAISLSGLMAWSLFARSDDRHFLRHLALWAVAAVAALLVWSPYWLSLPHGYAEVARNHSQYVVGMLGWLSGAARQIDAWGTAHGIVASFFCCFVAMMFSGAFLALSSDESRTGKVLSPIEPQHVGFAAMALCAFGTVGILIGVNAAMAIASLIQVGVGSWATLIPALSPSKTSSRLCSYRFRLADLLLAAWVIGLMVTTPLYRPYPRLTLPLLLGMHLLAARWFVGLPFCGRAVPCSRDTGWGAVAVTLVLSLVGPLLLHGQNAIPKVLLPGTASRNEFPQLARTLITDVAKSSHGLGQAPLGRTYSVLYVYAEPGLFFHLPADGVAVQPAGNLDFVDIEATRKLPTFLVTGPHAHRSQAFADEFAKRADQFDLIASYPYDASDFVRLDDVSATQLRANREPLDVKLYRVRVPK